MLRDTKGPIEFGLRVLGLAESGARSVWPSAWPWEAVGAWWGQRVPSRGCCASVGSGACQRNGRPPGRCAMGSQEPLRLWLVQHVQHMGFSVWPCEPLGRTADA